MKLNFWQWLGVLLLVVGGGLYCYRQISRGNAGPDANPSNMTVPVTKPA